jgi:hypothetical protein
MTLQASVEWDQFVRCYCIGQQDVMIMPYDPRAGYLSGEQYVHNPTYLSTETAERVARDVLTLNRALGYDINTVEFAIKDGVPYAIDFMNPAPDAELASVGPFYHEWLVKSVTDLAFRRLAEPRPEQLYRWDALLNPASASGAGAQALAAAASAAKSATDSVIPQSVREFPSDIASAVGDLAGQATGVVSSLVGSVLDAVTHGPDAESQPQSEAQPDEAKSAAKRTRTTPPAKKSATTAKRASTSRSKKSGVDKPSSEG